MPIGGGGFWRRQFRSLGFLALATVSAVLAAAWSQGDAGDAPVRPARDVAPPRGDAATGPDAGPGRGDASARRPALSRAALPESYEHGGGSHKLLLRADDGPALERLSRLGLVERRIDYGSLRLLVVGDRAIASLREPALAGTELRDDFDLVAVNRWLIDTREGEPRDLPLDRLDVPGRHERQLYLVQFVGPPKDEWLSDLKRNGEAEVVTYLPNDAYVIFASPGAWHRIARQAGRVTSPIQWAAPYHPAYRIAPALEKAIARDDPAVDVVVQFIEHPGVGRAVASLKAQALAQLMGDMVLEGMRDVRVRVGAASIPRLAASPDVLWIEPALPRELQDEVQAQIMAGNLLLDGTGPSAPGYLAWLRSKGFGSTFPFAIDVVDDGIDLGSTTDVHEDFLDASGASRIAYFLNYTNDAAGDSWLGHGSLTASIAGGYNDTQVSPWYEDAAGYQHGLGIAPYVLLGATKVFGYGLEMLPPYSTWTSNAYNHGARISTNSWSVGLFDGVNVLYNSEARAYDALVRDAVPGTAGNQEMSILFAAGNYGAGPWSVAAPGTGKNVLTVGDSENVRPETLPCSVTEGIADNAADIYYYSSRGPTYDGRKKPDLVAPGTIVMGAASRSDRFDPHPCGPYWPSGQTLYVRSGSSYSVPAVAGAAALARQWFVDRGWGTPSPAMIKAFLMATPTYLTGQLGNDTLPSNAQGYGRVDVGRALDGAPNLRVDQSHVFGATGQTYSLSGTIATSALPFRVMLAWTDAPGPVFGTPWVNNLDLEVTVNGALYRGNVFSGAHSIPGAYADFRNNTEAVFLPAGTTGSFSITVRAKGIYGNGIPGNADYTDQDFALFVYNGTQGAPPPDFAISAAPAEQFVQQGGSADYHLTLSPQNGFDGTVTFFVGGIPDGAAISFSRNPVTTVAGAPVDIALTVTTSAATPAATYPLTITGWNGPIPRSAVVQLVVQLADGPDIVRNYGSFQQFAIGISNDVTSTIMVPHSMTIKSTSVRVDIDHTTRGDLAVSLIGPDGTTVLLHDRTGGTADDLVTTYDISTRSVASLAAFTGRNTLGPWKLRIRSPERATAFSHGELKDWNVMFNGYYTAAPSLAIPDNDAAGVASTIDVSAPGVIEDLRVRVGISHTFKGDLQVSLVGPDGTRVLLHDRTGWFLDDIRTVYPDLTAPVESLDAFVGKRTDGTWRLEVRDLSSVVVGTLDTWEIDFRVFSPFGVSGPRAD